MKILSLFTHPQVDGIYSIFFYTVDVNGYRQLFVTNILQNIFFCVQHKKETHTGLE